VDVNVSQLMTKLLLCGCMVSAFQSETLSQSRLRLLGAPGTEYHVLKNIWKFLPQLQPREAPQKKEIRMSAGTWPACPSVKTTLRLTMHFVNRAAANEWFSTRVLVNSGSTLIRAASDEEEVVGQRTWDPKGQGLEQACICSDLFPGWKVANKIANFPRIPTIIHQLTAKKLQPEMEICNRK